MNIEYRVKELMKVTTQYKEFLPKIKIIKPDGETEWLTIREDELSQIIKILVGYDITK